MCCHTLEGVETGSTVFIASIILPVARPPSIRGMLGVQPLPGVRRRDFPGRRIGFEYVSAGKHGVTGALRAVFAAGLQGTPRGWGWGVNRLGSFITRFVQWCAHAGRNGGTRGNELQSAYDDGYRCSRNDDIRSPGTQVRGRGAAAVSSGAFAFTAQKSSLINSAAPDVIRRTRDRVG